MGNKNERQTVIHIRYRLTPGQNNRQTDVRTDGRQTDRHNRRTYADGRTDRQTDGRRDRQTDIQTDRQTDKYTYTDSNTCTIFTYSSCLSFIQIN